MSSSSPADRIAGSAPPVRAGRLDLRNVLRDVIDGASKDDILGLASELTHHMALTVFPFLLMVTALHSIPATRVTVIAMLEPALAAVVAYAWLGEELTATQIVGCLLVLAAVTIAQTARATDYARS